MISRTHFIMRTLLTIGVLFVFLNLLVVSVVEAGNTIYPTRGPQSPVATIWWNVIAGSGMCSPSTNYPNLPDNVRQDWMSGNKSLLGSQSFPQLYAPPGIYEFRCTHTTDATKDDEAYIDLQGCPPPQVWLGTTCGAAVAPVISSFTNNGPIPYNTTALLSYTATDATSCSIDNGIGMVNQAGETVSTPSLTTNTTYTLTCSSPGGSVQQSTTVVVNPAPPVASASFSGSPTCTIPDGSVGCAAPVSWTSSGAASVDLTDCGGGMYVDNAPVGPGSSSVWIPYNSGCYQIRKSDSSLPALAEIWGTSSCTGASTFVGGVCTPPATPLADLVPSPVTVSSGSVIQGGSVTLGTSNISNTGTVSAGPYAVGGFYFDLNNDGVAEFTINAGNVSVSTPAGGQNSISILWNVPVGTPAGTYRVSYLVDVGSAVNEGASGETNNFSGWGTTLIVTAAANPLPVVDAGNTPIAVTVPDTAQPIGASATDANGIASLSWSFVSGPGPTPTLTNPNTLTPTFGNMTTPGTYTFRLTATDNLGASNSDTMQVDASAVAVNGVCGTAERNYSASEVAFTGTLCAAGTASPASPIFPSQGGTSNWQCLGQNGGSNSSCSATRTGGSISIATCAIPQGASTCPVTVTWSSSNNTTPRVTAGASQISSGQANNATGLSHSVTYGILTFGLFDGPTLLNGRTINTICAPGNAWGAGVCVAATVPPTLTVTQSGSPVTVVRTNSPVSVVWDTNNSSEVSCSLTGAGLNHSSLPPGGTEIVGSELETGSVNVTITGRTTFVLTCPGPNGVVTKTIDTIPQNWES